MLQIVELIIDLALQPAVTKRLFTAPAAKGTAADMKHLHHLLLIEPNGLLFFMKLIEPGTKNV